jgi:AcrR family transcriptional regulator
MPEWIPSSASAKGRLVLAALDAFGQSGYEDVHVGTLAAAAETTTGPLYHHFGSKLGLYSFVRADVEQRVVDRIEGALAAGLHFESDDRVAALVVAFDYAVRAGFARMLSEPHPSPGTSDPIASALGEGPLGAILAAAWRAALGADDPEPAREALRSLSVSRQVISNRVR